MAQVTMDGREYVELISKVNNAEATSQLLVQTLIMGTLKVDATAAYRKVEYKVKAELPDTEEMKQYMQMRISDVITKLEQNPLAVQLLYKSGDNFFNPNAGHFTSYGWDNNVPVQEMSEVIGEMYEHLENGELLVAEEVENGEEE